MTIAAGTRLGPYEIVGLVGAGGMGEVYRARDRRPSMDRDVAIKVLSRAAPDQTHQQRLESEARATSAISHPNVLAIYDIGTHDGAAYLVEELIDGRTLRDILTAGAVAPRRAIEYARAIADGLAAAHARGVVHRDLKPENVMVTGDGRVKILDFGIAKLQDGGPAGNSTTVASATGPGAIVGTVAYMSPEQLRGQPVDARSDIFSLGVVLFEMLGGQRPFYGDTAADTQAAILHADPPEFPAARGVPAAVDRVVRRALEKRPDQRFQSAGDLAFALDAVSTLPSGTGAVDAGGAAAARVAHASWRPWAIAALAVGALAWTALRPAAPAESVPPTYLEIQTPLTMDPGAVAVSPDGRKVVFSAMSETGPKLWIRSLDGLESTPLDGTDGGQAPFWSPDGQSLGFFANGRLKRRGSDGSIGTLAVVPGAATGATWNAAGDIVFAVSALGPLHRLSASGGTPVPVTTMASGHRGHTRPYFLRDGQRFVFVVNGDVEVRGIYVGGLNGRPISRALDLPVASRPAVQGPAVAAGHVFFTADGRLYAVPFDEHAAEVTGAPVAIADNVAGVPGASPAGTLVYRTGSPSVLRQLAWFDRAGRRLGNVGEQSANAQSNAEIAPNGTLVAFQRDGAGNTDLWTVDLARGGTSRLTTSDATDIFPQWSPDGRVVVFGSTRTGAMNLYRLALDTGQEDVLLATDQSKYPEDWSNDGRYLLFRSVDPKTGNDLWALPLHGDRTPVPVARSSFDERAGEFSPDERWVAFQSDESGRFEVYLQPFPGPGRKITVSTAGGAQVRWRFDGKELFYVALDGQLMAVPVTSLSADDAELGTPAALFRPPLGGAVLLGIANRHYDVSRDGQRFLVNALVDSTPSPLAVILNWAPPTQPRR